MTDRKHALSYDDVRAVSPALEHYTRDALLGEVWKRPELSPRDRSMVTVAALIARIQTVEMPFHFALALDNGVKPAKSSEVITHLAFYSGWGNAIAAVAVTKDIFHQRGTLIDLHDSRSSLRRDLSSAVRTMREDGKGYREAVREFEAAYVSSVITSHQGHLETAAADLGVHRDTLTRILRNSRCHRRDQEIDLALRAPGETERGSVRRL